MYGLHTQNLVVALLVVEHGGCKIIEHILGRERAVGLCLVSTKTVNREITDLDPLVPDKKAMSVIIWRM